jgi:hypothetical protein
LQDYFRDSCVTSFCMVDQHTGARWKSDVYVATVKRGFVWEIEPMLRGANRRCEDLSSPLLHLQGRPKRMTFAGSTAADTIVVEGCRSCLFRDG